MTTRGEAMNDGIAIEVARVVRMTFGTDDVRPEAALDELGADSLAVAEFTLALEETFGIQIAEADFVGVRTIADVVAFVNKRRAS